MLYRTLKRVIERGYVEGMAQKLDVFLTANKITSEEYKELSELMSLIAAEKESAPRV